MDIGARLNKLAMDLGSVRGEKWFVTQRGDVYFVFAGNRAVAQGGPNAVERWLKNQFVKNYESSTIDSIVNQLLENDIVEMKPSRKQVARRDFMVADTGKAPAPKQKSYLRKPTVSIEPPVSEEEIAWFVRQGFDRITAKVMAMDARKQKQAEATTSYWIKKGVKPAIAAWMARKAKERLGESDSINLNALRAAARQIKHCGDYGTLYIHPSGKVHWTAADSDSPDNGYTDVKEIPKILKVPGVTHVEVGDEWSPDEEEGWKRVDESKDDDGWIGVDFDGTLAKHTKYKGATKLGDPVPRMVARVRRWVGRGKKVKIFTARADDERSVNAIKKWLKDNELPDLEITNLKDRHCIEYWDDKAVAVKKNTGVAESEFEDWWEPTPTDVQYLRSLLSMLKPVAVWGIPVTGHQYKIDQKNLIVTLVDGDPNSDMHQKSKKVFRLLGFKVLDAPEPPPEDDEITVVETIIEQLLDERRVNPADMERALNHLRRRNPMGYAQLSLLPFGPVPSYAWEDPESDWWQSEDAFSMLQSIRQGAEEGVKPGGPTRSSGTFSYESLLTESPTFKTLKDNEVKLDDEERAQVMKAGAVWHHGPDGAPSPAVKKAVVKGKTWYWCATHRAGLVRTTLKAAIKAFDWVETTS